MNENIPFEGSWYAYVHRPGAVSWLLPRKDSKKVAKLISAVSASWEDDDSIFDAVAASYESSGATKDAGGAASAGTGGLGLARQGSQPANTQSYVFSTCGLTVKQGLYQAAPEIWRVSPFVHCAPDNSAAIAFVGHLVNLKELALRYCSPHGTPRHGAGAAPWYADGADDNNAAAPCSPAVAAAIEAVAGGSLARQGSIERSLDVGAMTAAVVLAMYQHDSELVLLSELQGQYAMVILDSRRGAFAARDPSGSETLFYRIADDGSAAFASSRAAIPEADPEAAGGDWLELPPGHYIAGRTPKLHQFALTPEQLQVREMCEDLGPLAALAKRRSSLDNNGGRGARPADGDLFGFDEDA